MKDRGGLRRQEIMHHHLRIEVSRIEDPVERELGRPFFQTGHFRHAMLAVRCACVDRTGHHIRQAQLNKLLAKDIEGKLDAAQKELAKEDVPKQARGGS